MRGRTVMPFDLDETDTPPLAVSDGLVQTVVTDDPTDERQVRLVRDHLRDEAARSRTVTSVTLLVSMETTCQASTAFATTPGAVAVTDRAIRGGGDLTYFTRNPELVDALHLWGEAQTRDRRPRKNTETSSCRFRDRPCRRRGRITSDRLSRRRIQDWRKRARWERDTRLLASTSL